MKTLLNIQTVEDVAMIATEQATYKHQQWNHNMTVQFFSNSLTTVWIIKWNHNLWTGHQKYRRDSKIIEDILAKNNPQTKNLFNINKYIGSKTH